MTYHRHVYPPDIRYYNDTHADRDWMLDAACRGYGCDPELWFPPDRRAATARTALRICHECHVRAECLDYALTVDARFGIYGGLTEQDRTKLTGKRVYG